MAEKITIKGKRGLLEVRTIMHGTTSCHYLYKGGIFLASTEHQCLDDAIIQADERVAKLDIGIESL